MTARERLERDLVAWFVENAAPRTPDYVDDILRATATERQRPSRPFPLSWSRPTALPWGRTRTVVLLVLLALFLAATLALTVGSRPSLPDPYGPADNGLVAYSDGGDIVAVDPVSGKRSVITDGFYDDREPRYSPDGTHLAFIRSKPDGQHVVFVDAEGRDPVESTEPLVDIDTDSLAWSPDGSSLVVAAFREDVPTIFMVDANDGDVSEIATDYLAMGSVVDWRPLHEQEFMYVSGPWSALRLSLHRLHSGDLGSFSPADGDDSSLRPIGWTPDGKRFAYQVWHDDRGSFMTHLLDVDSGDEFILPVAHGRISNDGTRIVGFDGKGDDHQLCVTRIERGAHCAPIGGATHGPDPEHSAALQWSPDDQFILSQGVDGSTRLLDPEGKLVDQPAWLRDGGETWQRK
jgi:hypothetical protein